MLLCNVSCYCPYYPTNQAPCATLFWIVILAVHASREFCDALSKALHRLLSEAGIHYQFPSPSWCTEGSFEERCQWPNENASTRGRQWNGKDFPRNYVQTPWVRFMTRDANAFLQQLSLVLKEVRLTPGVFVNLQGLTCQLELLLWNSWCILTKRYAKTLASSHTNAFRSTTLGSIDIHTSYTWCVKNCIQYQK